MSITLSEKQFKNAAKRLRNLVSDEPSHAQALQILSQSLFDKPFEEIKKTLFEKETKSIKTSTQKHPVIVLYYGSESILTLNGDFVSQLNIGTESEISLNQLLDMAKSLGSQFDCEIKNVMLPEILSEEWETHDVLNLANKMGYFSQFGSIFDKFEEECSRVLFDYQSVDSIKGDWFDELSNVEEDEDPDDITLWYIEYYSNVDYLKEHNHYITFKELCDAKTGDGENWILTTETINDVSVSFLE